jgi:hypothetical protein
MQGVACQINDVLYQRVEKSVKPLVAGFMPTFMEKQADKRGFAPRLSFLLVLSVLQGPFAAYYT